MRKRKFAVLAMTISVILITFGTLLITHFGWLYAKQTVLLNSQYIPEYKPLAVTHNKLRSERVWTPRPRIGSRIGTLSIPSIHLSIPVVQGTDETDLSLGAGHDVQTALPGQGSNVFLAGHRDTVFSTFRYLRRGDIINFATPYGAFIYKVTGFRVVPNTDVALLAPTDYETLTLCTCYPFFYIGPAPDRYIVFTKLVSKPR